MCSKLSGNAKGFLKPLIVDSGATKLLKSSPEKFKSSQGHLIVKVRIFEIGEFEKDACRKNIEIGFINS